MPNLTLFQDALSLLQQCYNLHPAYYEDLDNAEKKTLEQIIELCKLWAKEELKS